MMWNVNQTMIPYSFDGSFHMRELFLSSAYYNTKEEATLQCANSN